MGLAAPLIVFLGVTLAVTGLLYALLRPRIAAEVEFNRRLAQAAGSTAPKPSSRLRGKPLEDILKEMENAEAARRKRAKPGLDQRLQQAALPFSPLQFRLISAGFALALFLAQLALLDLPAWTAAAVATGLALLLPHLLVEQRRNAQARRFVEEFPNALDVVVRGVRSGLPLADCLKIIASESQEPVRSEFRRVVEDQTLGMTNEEAVDRLATRLPLQEVRFFAIVLAIQARTGGSLSEALGNLSRVLRERKKMRGKIRAMSAEAKASAGIIGALPFAVAFFVYLTSPAYISLLFTTTLGNMVLVGCAVWMTTGILVMRRMINFEI